MTRPHRRVPLNHTFRFIHEPLGTSAPSATDRFIGREAELRELAARILLSNGGAFLVTGYRGVGKTTFVNRVVETVQAEAPRAASLIGPVEVVDIYLNFARPMRPVELMYHVLRELYLRLGEKRLLGRIDPGVARDLELAYSRTTATVAYSASDSRERGVDLGNLGLPLPWLSTLTPSFSFKRTRASSRDLAYLPYDDKSAEHDLIRIARRLTADPTRRVPARRSWIPWRQRQPDGPRLKIIFVFDELDKLDEGRESDRKPALDRVLNTLKNLFTTSGITFLFVAGKDLHDRWLEDIGRGDSIYESVFTYARYLPVMWQSSDQMCDPLIGTGAFAAAEGQQAAYTAFKKFLAFKGRGIPRRMIRGFNEFVRWDGAEPCLTFAPEDERQFQFYAGLHDLLAASEATLLGRLHGTTLPDRVDQRRLSLHYLTDWILQQGASEFTLQDVVAASKRLHRMIAPSDDATSELVLALVGVLTANHYLEEAGTGDGTQAVRLGSGVEAPARYTIPRRRLVEMGSLTGLFEQEAEVVFPKQPQGVPPGRYQVQRLIARGAMGSVYEAIDARTGQRVAVKQLASLLGTPHLRARFERESRILAGLQHPNIVRLQDVDFTADPPYLVMEYVEGPVLTTLIRQGRFADERLALKLMHDLVGTVAYLHQKGVLWRDAKPANIMITPEGRLVLLDFGIARTNSTTEARLTEAALGTPAYMSPEQFSGGVYDARSDIYALGIILYEMVTGDLPFRADEAMALMLKHMQEAPPPPSTRAAVSPALEAVILRCLEKDPAQRYASAGDLLAALPALSPAVTLAAPVRQAIAQLQQSAAREERGTEVLSPTMFAVRTAAPQPQPQPAWTTQPSLLPESDGTGIAVTLSEPVIGVGRSSDNEMSIDDNGASRYHARLTRTESGRYAIEDLNSANGTFVNEEQIHVRRELHDGDRVRIGEHRWSYRDPVLPLPPPSG
jgi:serine/threonine protein kinase/Cdc6-like AAA superfamily ATPase